jgi:hypothetical protein
VAYLLQFFLIRPKDPGQHNTEKDEKDAQRNQAIDIDTADFFYVVYELHTD